MPRAVMSATVSLASSTVSKTARRFDAASGLRVSLTVIPVTGERAFGADEEYRGMRS